MSHSTISRWAILSASVLFASACGTGTDSGLTPEDDPNYDRATETSAMQWWNAAYTYQHIVLGWHDTDLNVGASTPIQLRNPSKLLHYGIYGWGYMPEFRDEVTGATFRFLHLRPQHMYATEIGRVYPAGYIVGLSGGDTHDTGYPVYSSGPHLCVQTRYQAPAYPDEPFRWAFPYGSGGGGHGTTGGGSSGNAGCHSATLNRAVGPHTCVQSASDAKWYTCINGSWDAGEINCGIRYPWCFSQTLQKYEPPRTCVQSKFDKTWYQCDAPGWNSPVHSGAGPLGVCSSEHPLH